MSSTGGYSSSSAVAAAVPFDNATNGFASTDVQAAIEEARSSISNPSLDQRIWVEKSGNDTTGTGTFSKPFLTIGKALTYISGTLADASPTKRYEVNVGPGDYNENLSLIANTFVKGAGPLATRLTGTTLDINHSSWNVAAADNRSGFMDMTVSPACTFDFNAQTNNTAGKLYNWNIRTSGTWTMNANNTSSGINQLIIHDSQIFGAFSQTGCNTSIQDTTIQGVSMTVLSGTVAGQGAAGLTLAGGSTTGNLVATWTANGTVTLNLRGIAIDSATTLTASGASCTVNASTPSVPIRANRSFTSSAVLAFLNDQNASGLRSATTDVSTVAATAPTAGQSLVATSSTAATWGAVTLLSSNEITATGSVTTTSSTPATITSMTETPAAGTWLYMFNTDTISNAAGASVTFGFYLAGSLIAVSQRVIVPFDGGTLSALSARGIVHLQSLIVVNGSQVVDVRWSNSAGTSTITNRSLIRVRVA